MKTVREIMSPIVFSIEETAFLPEAAKSLRDHAITGAPVLNAQREYVGVLSQTDVNKVLARVSQGKDLTDFSFEDFGDTEDIQSVMVKEIMSPDILKISANATLEELGQSLLVGSVHRLLVEDKGEIVGLVTTTDLIHGFMAPEKSAGTGPPRPTPKPYLFETELTLEQDMVRLRGPFGAELELEPPPEFGGKGQYASPEDLFVASISSCLCLTFKEFAKKARIEVVSYNCRAIGRLEGDGVSQRFTRVDLYPKITVKGSTDRVEQILMQAKLRCLVGRSSDVIAVLHPKIESSSLQEI